MSAPLTRSFGKFASELKFEHLPKRAVDAVLTAYTDSVAVMYSGVGFPLVKHARAVSNTVGLVKESRLFLGSERAAAFVAAYSAVRPLVDAERRLMPALLRAAAFRFWLSRLWDWHLPRAAALLTPKDPVHFERVLRERIERPWHPPT